jgi:hypothetical protein
MYYCTKHVEKFLQMVGCNDWKASLVIQYRSLDCYYLIITNVDFFVFMVLCI